MSEPEHSSESGLNDQHSRGEIQEQLREDGFEKMAEFLNGPVHINQLEKSDFDKVVDDGYVVRLRNDDEEVQFAVATNDDLIQIRDGDRDGEFARPMSAYEGEFEDYVFSGQYEVSLILPEDAAFEVAKA